jgi:hypothetical protein
VVGWRTNTCSSRCFKRGKSTFINALLGAPVLPTGVVPLTAIATFIAWRESAQIRVRFIDDRAPETFEGIDADAIRAILARFVTEEANPHNCLGVDRVELFYPAAILRNGTIFIDTPGIGSTLTHNTETALRMLPECDASLFILSTDPPITETELSYLDRVSHHGGPVFFVINKIDYVAPEEYVNVAGFLRRTLAGHSAFGAQVRIFGVTARLGLAASQEHDSEGWERSGMAEIETHLLRYLASEKMQTLRQPSGARGPTLLPRLAPSSNSAPAR